nr:acetyl-CoA carboxylase biotin carboxyl carrier protein [Streptococcus halichoeri]
MELAELKDLMREFDASSLREFSFKTQDQEINFSKNDHHSLVAKPQLDTQDNRPSQEEQVATKEGSQSQANQPQAGQVVESPLVGVAYRSPGPDKANFVAVGDHVTKGQTLLIIEAMKVMNEIPAPTDGVITEILVNNEDVVEFGQGLVRIDDR